MSANHSLKETVERILTVLKKEQEAATLKPVALGAAIRKHVGSKKKKVLSKTMAAVLVGLSISELNHLLESSGSENPFKQGHPTLAAFEKWWDGWKPATYRDDIADAAIAKALRQLAHGKKGVWTLSKDEDGTTVVTGLDLLLTHVGMLDAKDKAAIKQILADAIGQRDGDVRFLFETLGAILHLPWKEHALRQTFSDLLRAALMEQIRTLGRRCAALDAADQEATLDAELLRAHLGPSTCSKCGRPRHPRRKCAP